MTEGEAAVMDALARLDRDCEVAAVDVPSGTITMAPRRAGRVGEKRNPYATVRWQEPERVVADPRLTSAVHRLYSLPPATIGAADVINAIEMGKAGKL